MLVPPRPSTSACPWVTKNSIPVEGASPQVHYESNTVRGLATSGRFRAMRRRSFGTALRPMSTAGPRVHRASRPVPKAKSGGRQDGNFLALLDEDPQPKEITLTGVSEYFPDRRATIFFFDPSPPLD